MMILPLKKWSSKLTGKKRTWSFDKFRLYQSGEQYAICAQGSMNCDCRGGVLTTGVGLKYHYSTYGRVVPLGNDIPIQVLMTKYWDTKKNRYTEEIGYLDSRMNAFRIYKETEETASIQGVQSLAMGTRATTVVCNDMRWGVVFVGGSGALYYDNWGLFKSLSSSPNVVAARSFQHRLFIAEKPQRLHYSSVDNAAEFFENLDVSGSLQFPWDIGEIVGLQELNNRLYIFFERGIGELECDGLPREFKSKRLTYGGGKISERLIGRCGKYIYFMAEDGLYRFDGRTAVPALREMRVRPSRSVSVNNTTAICEGKILFQFHNEDNNLRALVVYEDGESGYYTAPKAGLTESNSRAFCCHEHYVKTVCDDGDLETGYTYYFVTGEMNFGTEKTKILKKLRFKGEGSFHLVLRCKSEEIERDLTFENGLAEVETCWRGARFSMQFILQKGARIEGLEVEYIV